ncbi:protocadherin-23 [Xenopus tropicalis]|uniref:Dachsous cadherin-related 2 n=1 Tax=Xenopus tropicalis TaxID=8364 RepID=A0A6I8S2C4_XENTR|nr:protocadherin-23 [Xenopus tropicalis]
MYIIGSKSNGVKVRAECQLFSTFSLQLMLLLFCSDCCCRAQVYNLSLAVDEGLPPGTLVGDIRAGLPEGSPGEGFFLSEEDGESLVLRDFQVDSETGIVSTLQVLDRERREHYSFVAATLQGEVVQVDILVRDVNDHSPTFPVHSLQLQVSELTPPGTSFRLPAAWDPDIGEHGLKGYALLRGSQEAPFIIRYGHGKQGSGVEEDLPTWGQTVKISDKVHGDRARVSRSVWEEAAEEKQWGEGRTSTLGGLKSKPEEIQKPTEYIDLSVGAGRGLLQEIDTKRQDYGIDSSAHWQDYASELHVDTFATNVAEHRDKEDVRTHDKRMVEGVGADSTLHPLDLVLIQWLDREELDNYQLEVEAFDGGNPRRTGRLIVDIVVMDANDNPPVFDQLDYKGWVWENAPIGTSVCTVHATDPDLGSNGEVRYSLRFGEGYFTVDEESGEISVSRPLDREQISIHQLVVQARDGGDQPEVTSILLTVKVLDVNDNSPGIHITLITESGRPEVSEGARTGEYLARIFVSDPDLESEDEVWVEGDTERRLMQENAEKREGWPEEEPKTQGVTTKMVDEQENVMHHSMPNLGPLIKRTFVEQQRVSVRLEGGEGSFSLQPAGPQLYFLCVNAPLDRELKDMYELQILAWDTGSPPLQSHKTLLLSVTDLNDQPPMFLQPEGYQATISEATSIGTAVLMLKAQDLDEDGPNSRVTYSLQESQNSSSFILEPGTGVLSIAQLLDHESAPVLNLVAVATDHGSPPLSSSCTITITVEDTNDNDPIFLQQFYNVSLQEHTVLGHCFLQVKATDADSGPFGQIHYSVYDGFHNTKESQSFRIDPDSGRICVSNDIDKESGPTSYDLLVKAEDEGGLSAQAFVRVDIEDINDNAPVFEPSTYVTSISSHTQPGTEILNVMAIDRDEGLFGDVTYELLSGEHSSLFTIDSSTGIIYLISVLSHLEDSWVSLSVAARDKGGLTSAVNATVTMNILKTATAPAIFEKSRYTFVIAEDVPKGSAVGTVKAREPLNSLEPVSYRIISGNVHQMFTIHTQFGIIRTQKELDFESLPLVVLTVQSQLGSSSVFSSTQVNVTITDANDNPPVFSSENERISVHQNTSPGTAIYIAQATDLDSGFNGQISYSIASENQDLFIIDSTFGVLYLNATLSSVREHVLLVLAEDYGHPVLSSLLTLTIIVEQNKQSNTLSFFNLVHRTEISETLPINSHILQVKAYTRNTQSTSSEIMYSLSPTIDSAPFRIHQSTGWIFLRRSVDYEKSKTHNLKVVATSGDREDQQTATASIIVKILDENDNSPSFDHATHFFTVNESPVPHGVIGSIQAFDRDSGNNGQLSYFLLSEGNNFLISSKTGEIINCASLDHERKAHHELNVLVTDNGTPRRNATTTVYIIVADLNDNKPYFPQLASGKQLHVKVMEGQAEPMLVATVYAKDPDAGNNGTVVYFFASDESFGQFVINASTGEIWTTKALSAKLRPQYGLTVTASDQGTPPLVEHTVVNIEVISAFKEKTKTVSKIKTMKVPENTYPTQKIGSVISHEEAFLLSSKMHYRLANEENKGHFVVDSLTGDVYVSRHLDFETISYYGLSIDIQEIDKISPPNLSVFLTIYIEDTNDHRPLFPDHIIVLGVDEDVPVGTLLYTFKANDKDGSLENSKIRYSLNTHGTGENPFFIHEWEGALTTANELDREMAESFVLTVTATDQAANISHRRCTSVIVRIVIQDINDNPPQVLSLPVASVMEDAQIGSLVHRIVAKDPDEGRNGKIGFHIKEGNAQQVFLLDETTGWLTLHSEIDREVQDHYILTILALDDGIPSLSVTQTLTISLIDVNNKTPTFTQGLYEAAVPENQDPGLYVIKVAAVDYDLGNNSVLTYEILPGPAYGHFRINPETGELVTTTVFDREQQDRFIIEVLVKDGGSPPLSSTTAILCSILDENDHTPEVLFPDVEIRVPENQDLGIIHTVLAADKDAGNNGRLHFQITDGNMGGYFAINNTSGQLWATRTLDREDVSSFTITVECHDLGTPHRSTIAKLRITVLDENDNPPTFPKSQYRTLVREDLKIGSAVLKLQASDADEGLNKEIIYSLIDDTQGAFTVNRTTGNIVTIRTLDREVKHQYVFRVVASDCSLHNPKSATVKVLVYIEDVNDNSPVFTENPIHVLISPKVLENKTIANVHASDVDLGLNGTVVYNLIKSNPFFYITQEKGEVKLQMPLPAEFSSTVLQVQASDLGIPPNTVTGLVIIDIQGLDKEIAFVHNFYEAIILENSEAGTLVVTVKALYHNPNDEIIHYTVFSGDKKGAFNLNPITGDLMVKEPRLLDFETVNKFNLIISAESSQYTTYCRVTVFIQDDNDNAPVFDQLDYISFVSEGQPFNTFVIQVFAADGDSGINGQIDYSIISGNENNAFVLDSRHGILSTNVILDREIKSSYRLTVQATDRGSPSCSSTSVVTVLILDINDNAPTIPPMNTVLIAEDAAPGYSIGSISANDVDLRPDLSYTFTENGNPGLKFAIDRYSGIITLTESLDYEESSQHCLRIQASDSVYHTEAELIIKVLDVNDNPPVFTQNIYKVALPELTESNTFITTVSATDQDSEIYGPITYKIISPLKGFVINTTSGSVYTDMPLGKENKSTEIQILIVAMDNGSPPLTSTAMLSVTILDVNNYAPTFSEDIYYVNVSEDALVGDTVLTLTAMDLDWSPKNALIDFSIIGGNAHNLFYLESSEVLSHIPFIVTGKLIINQPLDFEVASAHRLDIFVSNQGFPPLNSSATIIINILDSNDNPPLFSNSEYHVSVREHYPLKSTIIIISATDSDTGENADITYSIVSGNDENVFTIDAQNGTVTLVQPLDYEETMKYSLTLQARDGHGSKRNVAFALLSITVLDENDFAPKFLFQSQSCNIYENVPFFSPVCSVNAIDLDSGQYGILSFSIQSSCFNDQQHPATFLIDSLTGDIYTKHRIDYEMQERHCLVVQVKDRSESSACVLVYIDIEGEDEFQPVFYQNQYLFDLPEENIGGQEIGKVGALDNDEGLDGVVHYFLEKPSQFFSINMTSGMIYLTRTVHKKRSNTRKNDEFIEFHVKAHSPKFDSKSAMCTVRVNISSALEDYPVMSANILSITFSISFVVFLLLAISLIGIILRHKKKEVVNPCGIKDLAIPAPDSNGKDCKSKECPKYDHIKTSISPDTPEWLGLVDIREKKDTGPKCRNSDSSGHGSTEGETAEDEEIKMINEYPIRKESGSVLSDRASRVPDSGIPRDSDLLSCESDETDLVLRTESTESIVILRHGKDECNSNNIHDKELPHTNHSPLKKSKDTPLHNRMDYIFVPTPHESRYGSLASLVASDEDLRGSYNWDYLLSWEPRFQALSSVFCDIGKLKDEKMHRHGLPKQKKPFIFPPPLITSVAQPGIRAVPPRMPTIMSGQTFLKYPRSPFFTNLACQPSPMSPTFSPSLSMLTVHTPSTSPVLSGTGVSGTSMPSLSEELLIQQEFQV